MANAEVSPKGTQPNAKIFISYSRKDMAFVDRLEQALEANGFKPLIDRAEIYAFEDWWRRIEALVADADTIVFTLSPDSVSSEVCRKEVEFAASLHKRFAPIVCRRVDHKMVPDALARLNFIFFDDATHFEDSITRLVDALHTDIGWIRKHTEFGEAARRWANGERFQSRGLLLRSPVLEDAELWISSRPPGAPAPTETTQAFITESRRVATRRRNILTGSLAAGLVLAISLAGLAYWQRGVAVTERQLAQRNFAAAKSTVDTVVFDMAQGLRDVEGMRTDTARRILGEAETAVGELASRTENDPEVRRSQAAMYTLFAMTYLRLGALELAASYAQKGVDLSRALLTSQPANTERRQDLTRSIDAAGDIRMAQGDRSAALAAFRESLEIRRAIAAANPQDAESQHDLLVSLSKVGEMLRDLDHLTEAVAAYREELDIARKLVAKEPGNAKWQHALSACLDSLGEGLLAQGDLAGALAAHQESIVVARALAAKDQDNTESRRVMLVDLLGIGAVLMAQGDSQGALAAYQESLDIARALVRKDPGNTQWQRDMSLCLDGVGDALWTGNKRTEALAAYREALGIGRSLSAKDQSNTEWQRVMSVNLVKVGDTLISLDDQAGAMTAFEEGLDIARGLARKDADNLQWQIHVTVILLKVGDIKFQMRDSAGAMAAYQECLDISRKLAPKSDDAFVQHQVFVSAFKLGNAKALADDKPGALASYQESLEIARQLGAQNQGSASAQIDLFIALFKVGTLTDPSNARPLLAEALAIVENLEREQKLTEAQKGWPNLVRTALSKVP